MLVNTVCNQNSGIYEGFYGTPDKTEREMGRGAYMNIKD